jgi:hypothetical protein
MLNEVLLRCTSRRPESRIIQPEARICVFAHMQQSLAVAVLVPGGQFASRRKTDLKPMTKFLSTLGFFGCALMMGVYLNAPAAGPVEAREDMPAAAACHAVEVAIDQGYGISQTEIRTVCDKL